MLSYILNQKDQIQRSAFLHWQAYPLTSSIPYCYVHQKCISTEVTLQGQWFFSLPRNEYSATCKAQKQMAATLELADPGTTHTCLPVSLLQPRLLAKHRHPSGKDIQFLPLLEMLFSLIQVTVMVEHESLQNDGMEKKHHIKIWRDRTYLLRRKTQWKQVELIQPAEHSQNQTHTLSALWGTPECARSTLHKLAPKTQRKCRLKCTFSWEAMWTNTSSLVLTLTHK